MPPTAIPQEVPQHCFQCGAELEIKRLLSSPDEAHGVLRCPRCGFESGFGWSRGQDDPLETAWVHTEEGGTRLAPASGDPSPASETTAAMVRSPAEIDVESEGLASLLEITGFPVFGLSPGPLGLRIAGHAGSWGGHRRGESAVAALTLWYFGHSVRDPANAVTVYNQNEKSMLIAGDAVSQLMEITGSLPWAQKPEARGSIHKFLNVEALKTASRTRLKIGSAFGQDVVWEVLVWDQPVDLLFGTAAIDGTNVSIAAGGPIVAAGFHSLAAQLIRIRPASPEAREWDSGYREYLDDLASPHPPEKDPL